MKTLYDIFIGKPEDKRGCLGEPDIDGRKILNRILNE
jgi:hypothetical protein